MLTIKTSEKGVPQSAASACVPVALQEVRRLVLSEVDKTEVYARRVLVAQLVLSIAMTFGLATIGFLGLLAIIEQMRAASEASEALSLAQVLATGVYGGLWAGLLKYLHWLWQRSLELVEARNARAKFKAYVCLCTREQLLALLNPDEHHLLDGANEAAIPDLSIAPVAEAAD